MSVAIEILDGLVEKLGLAGLTDTDIERQIIPQEYKHKLTQKKIVLTWNNKEHHELDRVNEALFYEVALGIYQPMEKVTDADEQKSCVSFVETIQDYLAHRDQRVVTFESGEARYQTPFKTPQLVDPDQVKQTGNFFSVVTFKYRYFKGRA